MIQLDRFLMDKMINAYQAQVGELSIFILTLSYALRII